MPQPAIQLGQLIPRRQVRSAARAVAGLMGALLACTACAGVPSDGIVRVVGGERREGIYVSPYAYEAYVRGELAYARGRYKAAAKHFRQARTGPADDPLVIARLARTLEKLGQHGAADEALEEGFELAPGSEALWLAKARIAEERGRAPTAIEAYERAAEVAPRSPRAPLALAELLRKRGTTARAEAVHASFAQRAGETHGAHRARLQLAMTRGDARAAVQAVRDLLRVAPARLGQVQRSARLALEHGHPQLAARLLEQLPDTERDPALTVRAFLAAGLLDKVEGVLATAAPEAFGGRVDKAELWLEAGHPVRAAELGRAAAIAEPSPRAWLVTGRAELARGRWSQAASQLARVPRGVRAYPRARLALAKALRAQALDTLAAEVLARALRHTEEVALRTALAETRFGLGDLSAALGALGDGGDASPRLSAARASLLERAGRLEAANRIYRRLAPHSESLPESARARCKAERQLAKGKLQGAIGTLRKRAEQAPEDLASRVRLVELLVRAGDRTQARSRGDSLGPQLVRPAFRKRLQRALDEGEAPRPSARDGT